MMKAITIPFIITVLHFNPNCVPSSDAFQSSIFQHHHHHQQQQQHRNNNSNIRYNTNNNNSNKNNSNQFHINSNNIITTKLNSVRPNQNQQLSSTSSNDQGGVTSTLISNLAVIALKIRLKEHTSVKCNVSSSSKQLLLKQSIGPVSVRGKDWSSPLGLTCKAIQADVDTCMLDMSAVLKRRKLILIEPARGTAMIAFNDLDFGNFLKHPLLYAQSPSLSNTSTSSEGERKFEFQKDDLQIINDPNGGYVIFYGLCMRQRWKCILKRGTGQSPTADIEVIHEHPSEGGMDADIEMDIKSLETELTMILSNFFNELVFELDGTFLAFKDLKFHSPKSNGSGGSSGTNVLFALDIIVKKFPSPGLAF